MKKHSARVAPLSACNSPVLTLTKVEGNEPCVHCRAAAQPCDGPGRTRGSPGGQARKARQPRALAAARRLPYLAERGRDGECEGMRGGEGGRLPCLRQSPTLSWQRTWREEGVAAARDAMPE